MDILHRLRGATHAAHRRLEDGLNLLEPPLDRGRFIAVLERFWGFHAEWERAIRSPALAGMFEPTSRTPLLAHDLAALGRTPAQIERLARCEGARSLAGSRAAAFGSLYVMEGSALGGRVVTGALREADWLPSGGLRYFDPYGAETGVMWRTFQGALRAASSAACDAAIVQGAVDTFDLLHRWLLPEPRA